MPSGFKITQEEAEKRILKNHGDDIDLSKFIFSTQRTKSIFICNVDSNHGEWLAHPKELWRTDGKKTSCPKCDKLKHKPKHSWSKTLKRLKAIHGDDYFYFEQTYDGVKSPIKVKCLIHEHLWEVRVQDLLKGGGCPKCGLESSSKKRVLKVDEFIERAQKTHGDKYDYSKVHQFSKQKEYVKIICPIHGEFEQSAQYHYLGSECVECWNDRRSEVLSDSWEDVLEDFIDQHGYRYEYDKSTYLNATTEMTMICKIHGSFIQVPVRHKRGYWCQKCGRDRIKESLLTPWSKVYKAFKEVQREKYKYNMKSYADL